MEGHLGPAQMRTRELRLSRLGGVAVATAASRTSSPYKPSHHPSPTTLTEKSSKLPNFGYRVPEVTGNTPEGNPMAVSGGQQ